MSFDLRSELEAAFADSASPEGVTPPVIEIPVTEGQVAVTETPVVETTAPKTDLKHGDRIGELMVVDPKKPADMTQFVSAQKMQQRINELELKFREKEEAESVRSDEETVKARKGQLQSDLSRAKTEKERMDALIAFKNWERDHEVAKRERIIETNRTSQEQAEVLGIVQDWDSYYAEQGYDPKFIQEVNYRVWAQTQGDPVAYTNLRATVISDYTTRAARGLVPTPFIGTGTGTPTPPNATPANTIVTPPPAVTPGGSVGEADLMDMFFNSDLAGLNAVLNTRR